MTIYCEFWCSPLRQEIYSQKFISAETFDTPVIDEIKENYIYTFGDFWFDVFGDVYAEVGGLFKVLCKIDVNWEFTYDWEGCPDYDVQFDTDVLGKNKCGSFAELKSAWLELTGRSEEYNNRAIVQIVYHERGTGYYDQGGTASVIEFNPSVNKYGVTSHWDYTDYRNNRFVKETDPHYNKLYLLLGGYEE